MSDRTCEQWRESLAIHLLGDQMAQEMTGLLAHLDGCGDCQVIASEMTETAAMLTFVDPSLIEPTASVPPELTARVLGELHDVGVSRQRRRRVVAVFGGVVGAVAAALLLVTVFGTSPSSAPRERVLALDGAPSASASAVLVRQSWGTTLQLSERGLPGGQVYTVSMETKSGRWWTAGTYRPAKGQAVFATMACAVSLQKITGVRVVNATGITVLDSSPTGLSYY